jgi:EAL domain
VGGHRAAQPELASIIRLTPAILRLGRDWIRGVDQSAAKRAAVQIIGQLAGQLDAWILADSVNTAAELRALAGLEVPVAQGPFIGGPQPDWPAVDLSAPRALPSPITGTDGGLRGLMQQAYTATDGAAATAVLPETTGFDVVVVVDEHRRPVSVLEQDAGAKWACWDALTVNIDTPVADAVARATTRPRPSRFSPLVCTDAAGRFWGSCGPSG